MRIEERMERYLLEKNFTDINVLMGISKKIGKDLNTFLKISSKSSYPENSLKLFKDDIKKLTNDMENIISDIAGDKNNG